MNYLIEPQRTLSQFIFKDNSIVATMDVYDTLKYFFRLEYYKDAISDYFNSKYLHEISQDQFQGLIAQIDEKVFKENTFEVTLKTIKAVASFINESTDEDLDRMDLDVLSHIFKDRALDKYTALVDQLKEKQRENITFIELETILQEESIASLESSEPEEAELEVSEATQLHMEAIQDIEESKPEVEVENIEIGEMAAPEPEIEEEEEEEEEEETQVAPAAPAAPAPEPEQAPKPANVASEMADFVASQISTDQPLGDLQSVIQGRAKKKIIKKLFRKKENEYNSFIDLVNQHSTWKDASVIIDDEFYERGINPYSKEAIMFSDLIYLRFFPKDKYVGEQRD